jgi:predicted nucleic acid-binding protein
LGYLIERINLHSQWHYPAYKRIAELAEGKTPQAIPWPCLHEFLAIMTHPRTYSPPTPLPAAIDQVEAWLASPSLILLTDGDAYWPEIRHTPEEGLITGHQVHDARIAVICSLLGVRELWTADRDFSRFKTLYLRNPLIG